MSDHSSIIRLLKRRFSAPHVDALVKHYDEMIYNYQTSSWEVAILKAGKFVEAVLKALWLNTGNVLPLPRKFKVASIISGLENIPAGKIDDSIRRTIPRACAFIYDIASNRGARHDPSEVNPNEIDAAVVVSCCSWILSESIRYSQGGAKNTQLISSLLSGFSQRRYPQVEEIDGRIYFHLPNLSARKVALLTLWYKHPNRVSKDDLFSSIKRHRYSEANIQKAIGRLAGIVDVDDKDGFRLLQPGLSEAEKLVGRNTKITLRK